MENNIDINSTKSDSCITQPGEAIISIKHPKSDVGEEARIERRDTYIKKQDAIKRGVEIWSKIDTKCRNVAASHDCVVNTLCIMEDTLEPAVYVTVISNDPTVVSDNVLIPLSDCDNEAMLVDLKQHKDSHIPRFDPKLHPIAGSRYKHYKYGCKGQIGGLYAVVGITYSRRFGQYYALYIPCDSYGIDLVPWAKPVSQWNDDVNHPENGQVVKRFTLHTQNE